VRFHGRRVTKVGPEVKHGLFRVAGRARNPKRLPPEGWGPLNNGCERRTRALPGVSNRRIGLVHEMMARRHEGKIFVVAVVLDLICQLIVFAGSS
jgi:hypothetical protein